MTYAIGTLLLRSNIDMPAAYEVFRIDEDFENSGADTYGCELVIESSTESPDLTGAIRRAEHELMIVWEREDSWVYESIDSNSFLTVTRDYSLAKCYCSEKQGLLSYQPLIQAVVECCLINAGTAVIHAACVSVEGKAVLFSAPSGDGKSTRANLWIEYLGASWISGDRPAIQPKLGLVHGVPWDGKDQVFVNEAAPIQAIAEIRRADRTYARKMTMKQKRLFLSNQLLIPMWDPILTQKSFIIMKQMIDLLPIYRLNCDITEESVRQAYELLYNHPEMIFEEKEDTVMKMKKDFSIIEVGGDYMAIPVGENVATFGGTVVLNEVSAFILKAMSKPVTEEELLNKMLNEYDIDIDTATRDLKEIIDMYKEYGLIE